MIKIYYINDLNKKKKYGKGRENWKNQNRYEDVYEG